MTRIAILQESTGTDSKSYRAVAGEKESVGKTPGEALDSLTNLLDENEAGTLVIVQHLGPDRFFGAQQQNRLGVLMERWRDARNADKELSPDERAELEALVNAETEAARLRAEAALAELGK
jgi:hypothetical protein